MPLGPPVVDHHVLSFDMTRLFQSLSKGDQQVGPGRCGPTVEKTDDRHCGRLSPRHENAAERCGGDHDRGATALHWITSSARSSSDCGMLNPKALAVFRLIKNSKVAGCSTGRSAGLAPLRIRST